jgi:ribosomal protein S18 acetylase RimI-like enzyme
VLSVQESFGSDIHSNKEALIMFTSYTLLCETPAPALRRAVRELNEADRQMALTLLSENPTHSVHLRSIIEDNGFNHPSNRGLFFGYFEDDRLTGVALLGHATMIYARPESEPEAIAFFAETMLAHKISGNVVFGPRAQVEAFWSHLAQAGRQTRMVREMRWYICHKPASPLGSLQLRRANQEELEAVAEAQADMIVEATGKDPREADAAGFSRRIAERIDRKRTWIKLEEGKVVFKSEIQSLSAEVAYLEGIWVHPEHRGRSIARTSLTELLHRLLKQQLAVCLVAEADDEAVLRLYEQVGFVYAENYQARYLEPLG